jgi:4-amino-4-deoxy-L-arabinose transferase-like glycosyltransferase
MPEITKTKDQRPKTKDQLIWLFFALFAFFIYFFALGSIPLLGPDEPRYAQVAREMFQRNDFITPTLGGFDWFEKPALLYWLEIVSYKFFGVSEFAARFGSAVFGLGTIFSLWILGKNCPQVNTDEHRLENQNSKTENQRPKTDFANWLFLISASSIGLLTFSRAASFDIILTFPITASLVGFFIFEQSNKKTFTAYYLPLIAFYFFIGVALLAKGLVGVVFPFAIVAFYFVLSRNLPSKTFVVSLFWGTILSLSVAAIWYVPMYRANGWKFIDEFFIQQQFERYTSNKYLHPQPFWFFWLVLPLMTLPWLPFFLASIWSFFKVQSPKSKVQSRENSPRLRVSASPLLLFSFSWLLVPLIFFSFSGSKLPGYILPALPAALILTAEYVSRFVRKSKNRKMFVWLVAFATFAVAAVCLQFFVVHYSQSETIKPLIETANANGYTNEKVLNLNTISHSAEFYAASRLVRSGDGKQRRFFDAAEIVAEMKRKNAKSVLVLVPIQFLNQLTESDLVEAKVLGDNTELTIVLVKSR